MIGYSDLLLDLLNRNNLLRINERKVKKMGLIKSHYK